MASVPSPKSCEIPAEESWSRARRDDDDVSRRYVEEEQRSHGPRGPARCSHDFGDGTLRSLRPATPHPAPTNADRRTPVPVARRSRDVYASPRCVRCREAATADPWSPPPATVGAPDREKGDCPRGHG